MVQTAPVHKSEKSRQRVYWCGQHSCREILIASQRSSLSTLFRMQHQQQKRGTLEKTGTTDRVCRSAYEEAGSGAQRGLLAYGADRDKKADTQSVVILSDVIRRGCRQRPPLNRETMVCGPLYNVCIMEVKVVLGRSPADEEHWQVII
jgi:hypothetical protein